MSEMVQAEAEAEMGRAVERKHPEWIRARMPGVAAFASTRDILREKRLHSVCEEAQCPNISECFAHNTATFMILGNVCTRRCTFCAVSQANPGAEPPEADEPWRLAEAARDMGLRHVVITSVARDDLPDQGAGHFARCAEAVKSLVPDAAVEVLIPDFRGERECLRTVVESPIDVMNHNTETVPRLYARVRRGAKYWRTMTLLSRSKEIRPELPTKSGLMLGLGEAAEEIHAVLCDLREAQCDILTLGQYLQPTGSQVGVARYLTPAEFEGWRDEALALGFRHVESGPLVRSSYHAWNHVAG